jgi:putative Holliday junction resolvase
MTSDTLLNMHRYLALDIGTRKTGVAFASDDTGIALPLPTLQHQSIKELVDQVTTLCRERSITQMVIGLPRLLSGEEGEQALYVRGVADQLAVLQLPITFVDERYTTSGTGSRLEKRVKIDTEIDDNAAAASHILGVFLKY